MYDGNPGEIDFGSSYREIRVSAGGFELSGVDSGLIPCIPSVNDFGTVLT